MIDEDDAIRQWAERFLLQHGKIAVTREEQALLEAAERDLASGLPLSDRQFLLVSQIAERGKTMAAH